MPWKTTIALLLAVGCLLPCSPARAEVTWTKLNWDVGVVKYYPDPNFPPAKHDLTYRDAHVEIQVAAYVEYEGPNKPQTMNGGFAPATPAVTPDGQGNTFVSVDWGLADPNHPVVGASHIGVGFEVDTLSKNPMDCRPKIIAASLTGVSCPSLGIVDANIALPLTTPGSSPHGSAQVRFANENILITGPMNYRNVDFYKTSIEPALSDLTAVNFPSLDKTWLSSVPDFVLLPGESRDFIVPNVDPPEWLISYYETDWLDPVLSGLAGGAVYTEVYTWWAGPMVPEPVGMVLLAVGGLALLRRRR